MSRQGDFLIYCVEIYKNARHLTGRQKNIDNSELPWYRKPQVNTLNR